MSKVTGRPYLDASLGKETQILSVSDTNRVQQNKTYMSLTQTPGLVRAEKGA